MFYQKSPQIEAMCLYCENALCQNQDEDEVLLHCKAKKSDVEPNGHCFRFRFDALKYQPKRPPAIQPLDEELYKELASLL